MNRKGCLVRGLLALMLFAAFVLFGVWYVYRSTQQLPDFYKAALEVDEQQYAEAGAQFESQVAQLSSDLRQAGLWEATFTEEQVNGWLASDLPRKFPDALPRRIRDPRLSIVPESVTLVFQVESQRLSGVVTCDLTVYCTDLPNQIAVRFDRVRSGMVSLPVSQWLDPITTGLQQAGVQMEWTEDQGRPVALVTLPDAEMADGDVIVDNIELQTGQVTISGHTLNGSEPFGLESPPGQDDGSQ